MLFLPADYMAALLAIALTGVVTNVAGMRMASGSALRGTCRDLKRLVLLDYSLSIAGCLAAATLLVLEALGVDYGRIGCFLIFKACFLPSYYGLAINAVLSGVRYVRLIKSITQLQCVAIERAVAAVLLVILAYRMAFLGSHLMLGLPYTIVTERCTQQHRDPGPLTLLANLLPLALFPVVSMFFDLLILRYVVKSKCHLGGSGGAKVHHCGYHVDPDHQREKADRGKQPRLALNAICHGRMNQPLHRSDIPIRATVLSALLAIPFSLVIVVVKGAAEDKRIFILMMGGLLLSATRVCVVTLVTFAVRRGRRHRSRTERQESIRRWERQRRHELWLVRSAETEINAKSNNNQRKGLGWAQTVMTEAVASEDFAQSVVVRSACLDAGTISVTDIEVEL